MLEGDIGAVIETIRSMEPLKNLRIVIDPMGEQPVEITPDP